MTVHRRLVAWALALSGTMLPGCAGDPGVSGAFDKTFSVMGHTRLEVTNPSGDVEITGSTDGKVHIHGDVRATGRGFDKPKERLDETLANPGVDQKGDTIRVGKHISNSRNLTIAYKIEVPHDTEVNVTAVSGSQTIRNVRGPVTAQGVSGAIRVEGIDRDTQITTVSGSLEAHDIADDVRASSASGSITVNNPKGDVHANTLNGPIQVRKPAGRVEADSASGSIDIEDATNDAKVHGVSGNVTIHGDPGEHGYWDLKTVSGRVQLHIPSSSNFRFSAEAISGELRTDIPIMIEEQGKHSLRAHIGAGGGRVEVRTVSGEIRISDAH